MAEKRVAGSGNLTRLASSLLLLAFAWAQTPLPQTPPPPPPQPSVEQPAAPVEKPPVILENTGKPMRVPVECGGDEIQSFGLTCTIDDPCPVYLELVEVEPLGARLLLDDIPISRRYRGDLGV